MEQNYLPLFRKYRPQSFKDIVGQESLVKALSNAIELNRIANAYLFCGPRGTGKTSSARILAKSLNCEHGPTLEPCQKCASCIDITNATGLDVIEIDAASNRGIQDAKELIAQAQYAPINGKYKIFIIDEVHMLSNDAFNALLKTFEEPPKNVIFILATTEPHKVLETIVSRCQRFDLRRITVEDIAKRLREISDLENIKITDSALYTIAKNVSGGLRDSLALLDQVSILGVKEEIDKDLIEELLGKINFDTLLNLLEKINSQDIESTLLAIDNIYTKGNEPRNLAENFIEFLRNVLLVLNSQSIENITGFTNLISDDIEKIKANNFDKDKILSILNTVIEYYKEIKISTNPYLWMELAGIASCNAQKTQTNSKVQIPQAIPQRPQPATKPQITALNMQAPIQPVKNEAEQENKKIQPAIIPAAPAIQADTSDIGALWTNIINTIQSLPTKAFFTGVAKLVDIKDLKITLRFLNENTLLQAKTKLPQLQTAVNTVCDGYSVEFIKIDSSTKTIDVKPRLSSARPTPQAVQNNSQTQPISNVSPIKPAEQEEDNDEEQALETKQYSPKVQEMIEQFNGRIIE
ncbi:MAG: DNA polymerase III subunit gamma/tau [Candidatus Gastranaerophilales bacterium]|nr:DNA polymerase III subunit gamma/tau [Candidatus Gastranaerophilales bacterium]